MKDDDEYFHAIWINESELPLEFHYVWSVLEFGNKSLFGKLFNRGKCQTAMRLHYASLTPVKIWTNNLRELGRYLRRNVDLLNAWYAVYGHDVFTAGSEAFHRNFRKGVDFLVEVGPADIDGYSLVYRKSLPEVDKGDIVRFLRNLENFAEKVSDDA